MNSYISFGVLFVAAVFAHCANDEQMVAWAEVLDVLSALVVVYYVAFLKMKPKTRWHGFWLAMLTISVITPFTIVCVSDLSGAWGHRVSQAFSPDEAIVDVSDAGLQLLGDAKDTFKILFRAVVMTDPQILASSKNQVHWWIAYVFAFIAICFLIHKGGKNL